jgi:hypothetical protein
MNGENAVGSILQILSMSAGSDDDDPELAMLRAAALRSKRSAPEESALKSETSDIQVVQRIETVERPQPAQASNFVVAEMSQLHHYPVIYLSSSLTWPDFLACHSYECIPEVNFKCQKMCKS